MNRPDRSPRRGSAAVEFAMVALPFFIFLLGILEIGILLLVDAMFETAVADASRQIRTGQAQMQNMTPEALKTRLCSNMTMISRECETRTFIDVRKVESFTSPLVPDPIKDGLFDASVIDFIPGAPGDYVLVRVWYEHPIVTPFIAEALSRTRDGRVMLTTSMAFRNEPYL